MQRKLHLLGHMYRMNKSREIKSWAFGLMGGNNKARRTS